MTVENVTFDLISPSSEATQEIGRVLASQIGGGDVIALSADLGGGKTTFTQGICDGLNVQDYVTSPTFTLVQEYQGDIPIAHFDFYRMQSVDEIEDLGLDIYFNPQTLSIIEWAERGEAVLPDHTLYIRLSLMYKDGLIEENVRKLTFKSAENRPINGMEKWLS